MNRDPKLLLRHVLSAGALLALGACAQNGPMGVQDVSTLSPLQLIGLTVQSADGKRTLGDIDDLVLGANNRVEQAVIATGAPMYPTERKVVVDVSDLRYAPNRQAVILIGMTPAQFAELPPTDGSGSMVALGGTAPAMRTGLEPTNWTGATVGR